MAVQQQPYYQPPSTPPPGWGRSPLEAALHQVVRRMRWVRWVRCASFGALVGEVAALIAVALAHFDMLPDWMMLELLIPFVISLGILVGTVVASLRPIDAMAAARVAETRLGLKERLSSALEFGSSPSGGGAWGEAGRNPRDPIPSLLVQLQQRDAAAYAGAIRPKEAVPFRWPWQLKALIVMTAILILAIVVPNLPMFVSPADRLERGIVSKEGQRLEQQARVIDKVADVQQLPHTHWAAQQMHRLAQQMMHGKMNKRQAFVKYGQLTQQMQNVQKQLAQNGGAEAAKSLSQAGRQLAQSLQSQSKPRQQNNAGPQSSQSGQGGAAGSKSSASAKSASNGAGVQKQHGFNIPGSNNGGSANNNAPSPGPSHPSNEMRQAAEAMQHGDGRGLSQQLRDLAQRAASGQMRQDDRQQAAQDLQKLSDALKGTSMKETQQHAQAAADAMKQGDTQRAADEMRKAADAADREIKQQQDKDAMRDAQNSLQKSQDEMAGASSPSDVGQQQSGQSGQSSDSGNSGSSQGGQGDSSGDSGQGDDSGSDQQAKNEMKRLGSGEGQGQGNGGDEPGEENGGAGSANRAGHGGGHANGRRVNSKWAKFQGPPGRLNPNFDPSKFPKYNKIYLGKPHGGGQQGELGKTMKTRPGAGGPHPVGSQVPYYNYVGPAKQAAEHAVDHEDIPPSYKGPVQKYFDSLTPGQ